MIPEDIVRSWISSDVAKKGYIVAFLELILGAELPIYPHESDRRICRKKY